MSNDFCAECGTPHPARFEGEAFTVEHKGAGLRVEGMSGWRCGPCGEIMFDPASATRYAEAGDTLVLAARREEGQRLRRIRRKLHLSQVRAASLTGGGHNAFSRYESGEIVPLAAVTNLFTLLDRHPELIRELYEQPADVPTAEASKRRGRVGAEACAD